MEPQTKAFDCIAFKDEMQKRAEAAAEGLSQEEHCRRLHEAIAAGDFGDWWRRLFARHDEAPSG